MSVDADAVRKVFKGGGLLFFGLAFELGISFLGKVFIARELSVGDYGSVFLGLTVATMVATLTLLGLNQGIGRFLPRYDEPERIRGVLVSGFQIGMPIAILAGAAVVLLARPIASGLFGDPSIAPVIRVFGLVVPLVTFIRLVVGTVQGMHEAIYKVLINDVTRPFVRVTGMIVAIALGFGAIGIAWAYVIAYAASGILGLYYLVRRTSLFDRGTSYVPMRREMLAFSLPLVVSIAMMLIINSIDTLMLGYFDDTDAVGVYNVIYPLAKLLTVGVSVFQFLFMPIVSQLHAEGESGELNRFYQVVTKWIFLGSFPVFLVLALFPTMTITITFGAKYGAGAPALTVLAIGFFAHATLGLNNETLTSTGRTRAIMYTNLVACTANVVLNAVLIPRYSFLGAALATAATYFVLNGLYSYVLYQEEGVFPFNAALARPAVVALALVSAIYLVIRAYVPITVPILVAAFVGFLALYAAIILRFGGIQEEEVMLVLSFEERFDVDLGPFKAIAHKVMR